MKPCTSWTLLLFVVVAAFFIRFHELDRSAVRSDEINFLNLAQRGQSVADLWKNPPWMNQIPLADSIAVAWHWIRPGEPNDKTVREPFALLGTLTVVGVAAWLAARRRLAAGMFVGLWMALLPFHVYQSREAYYYVVVMAMAAGMTLLAVDLLVKLRAGDPIASRAYFAWTIWAVLTCLTHMSTWVITAICWLLLLVEGLTRLDAPQRRRHVVAMISSAGVIAVFMIRWIMRALAEMQKVSQADGHLGGAFGWVGPRVFPFFTVGANTAGVAISVIVALCGICAVYMNSRGRAVDRDPRYRALSMITFAGFAAAYAYIGSVGGGAAKISYFTTLLPVFLVWAVYTMDFLVSRLPGRMPAVLRIILPLVMVLLLAQPAWMVTRLDGKPVPYKLIRAWLDSNLDPGSVAVVDRWYEPWNEMARYAPSNVVVTFTVPDEPYENYRQLQWREVTRQAIEQGKVQAFIRLTRNHENRDGLWTWPESYFARRAVIVNEAGLWQREHGYGANEDFYAANTNRLVTEIFYNLRGDYIERARREGRPAVAFFEQGMPYEKSGPMGLFRFQTRQFMDWHSLEQQGQLNLFNVTTEPRNVLVQISAISPQGPKLVDAGAAGRFRFAGGQMQVWTLGPLLLQPGDNPITFTDPVWAKSPGTLLISSVDIKPEDAP